MRPIIIHFDDCDLGRVIIRADVLRGDSLSHGPVRFKLDSGSDFTIVNYDDLKDLGYTDEFLRNCPKHTNIATAAEGSSITLRYLSNISIMFEDREIQGCRIYFSLEAGMRNLFGNDILKYFNREINYDMGEMRLNQRAAQPLLAAGQAPLQIYSLED
ncbi:MAG: retroviral-like aspartic protease family protein [Clostridiales bacterium]|jgi:hypothetical protein|nr:retroviral-like aspartic protease family protein [Clostridiales bacterium]